MIVLYEGEGSSYEETARDFAAELRRQLSASGAAADWQDDWVINCAALGPQGQTTGLTEFSFAVLGRRKVTKLALVYNSKRKGAA